MKHISKRSRFSATGRLICLALPLAVAAFLASGGTPTHAQSDEPVSFSAVYEGQFYATNGDGPVVTQNGGAYGQASWLGASSAGFSQVVDTSTDPNSITNGSFSILAEDSSTIFGVYDGQISAPDDSGMATISGTYTVTDGTGLFLGASGSGTLSGQMDVVTGNMTISFDGTISPPVPADS